MRTFGAICALLLVLIAISAATNAWALPRSAPTSTVQVGPLGPVDAKLASARNFDALRATNAYLATVKGDARRKSDAYFEGGYWFLLVDALYAIVVAAALLWSRLSA